MLSGLISRLNSSVLNLGPTARQVKGDFERVECAIKKGFGWRTGVIFNTNLRTAYNAGRYRQQTDPEVLKRRPWFVYRHGNSLEPRPLHLSWDGTVLPADDPWWKTHYTPNGWGCKCRVESLSESEMARGRLAPSSSAPDDGFYEWKNPETGETRTIPDGIDPGWDYNVGVSAWGQRPAEAAISRGERKTIPLTYGSFGSRREGILKPEKIASSPFDHTTAADAVSAFETLLGGKEKIFSVKEGKFRIDLNVNASVLVGHMAKRDPSRLRFLPLLPEVLENPQEVWIAFEQDATTGKILLKTRVIRAVDYGKEKGVLAVFEAIKGQIASLTFIPTDNLRYLNSQRTGKLVWERK